VEHSNVANCRLEEGERTNETRYIREFAQIADFNTGTNEQELAAAKKNLRILFSGESSDGYERLKIAELTGIADDTIVLNEDYIPPCFVISASHYLMNTISGIISSLASSATLFEISLLLFLQWHPLHVHKRPISDSVSLSKSLGNRCLAENTYVVLLHLAPSLFKIKIRTDLVRALELSNRLSQIMRQARRCVRHGI